MADSLDGNYVLDSDDVGATGAPSSSSSSSLKPAQPGAKRAREANDDGSSDDEDESQAMRAAAGASSEDKKRKRKERQKKRKARLAVVRQEEEDARVNPAAVPPEFQADWLRKEMRKCKSCKDLSEIELDEIAMPQRLLVDSTSWQGSRDVKDVAPFIKAILTKLVSDADSSESAVRKAKGSPSLLMLTNNALRASHLARELRGILPSDSQAAEPANKKQRKNGSTKGADAKVDTAANPVSSSLHVAKLFSRHFSPAEQTEFLSSHHVLAGAGTAQRIAVLIQRGALKLDNLTTLVLDAGWRDEKMRGLMDEEGGREGVKEVWDAVRSSGRSVKIVLF